MYTFASAISPPHSNKDKGSFGKASACKNNDRERGNGNEIWEVRKQGATQ